MVGAMQGRLLVIVGILCLVGAGLFALSDSGRMTSMRMALGLGIETEVPRLEPAEIETELARLAGLPVPGVTPAADGGEVPPLGRLAEAGVRCTVETGAVVRTRKQRALMGLQRVLLVFGAIGADPETPLLEPRFRTLQPLFAEGPRALQKAVAAGTLTAGERALLADFHATYSQIEHPLFNGLELYERTFQALDFGALASALAERRDAVAGCTLADVLPPPPEPEEAEAAAAARTTEESPAAE